MGGAEAARSRALPDLGGSPAPRDVRHGYAVLRGLTSAGGGMVAAATMSRSEQSDSGRIDDHRYAWLRDQCYNAHDMRPERPPAGPGAEDSAAEESFHLGVGHQPTAKHS